jgi:hypothetical protein
MAIHDFKAEDRFEAASAEILDQFGVTLTIGTNFDDYRTYVAEARPDHRIGDPCCSLKHDMSPGKACWIVGRDEQVLRVLPTDRLTVAEYFRQRFHEFSPSEMDIDFVRSRYRAGPGAKRMSGKVVYSGETWVGGEPGQYRGTGISSVLGRFALLTALKEFGAQYVVGFMTRPVAYKGFCLRMGFMHAEPGALRWYVKDQPDAMEGVMVYMSDEDIRFILELPAAELESIAA